MRPGAPALSASYASFTSASGRRAPISRSRGRRPARYRSKMRARSRRGLREAVQAADDALLPLHEVVDRHLDHGLGGGQPDRDEQPLGCEAGERLAHRRRPPDGLDERRHAAAGQRHHLLGDAAVARVDRVGRAEAPGQLEAPGVHVDREDRMRPRHDRAEHRREADAADAVDRDRPPGRAGDAVQHRADAGHDGACGDRGDLRRHAVRHRDDARLRDDDLLREAGDAHQVMDPLRAAVQPGRAVEEAVRCREHAAVAAEHGVAGDARVALAAARPPGEGDPLPDREPAAGRGAERLDDAGALVADDDRQPRRQVAGHVVQVAVADAGRLDAHEHLAGARRVELDVLDRQRLAGGAQHRGSHGSPAERVIGLPAGSWFRRFVVCSNESGPVDGTDAVPRSSSGAPVRRTRPAPA